MCIAELVQDKHLWLKSISMLIIFLEDGWIHDWTQHCSSNTSDRPSLLFSPVDKNKAVKDILYVHLFNRLYCIKVLNHVHIF